MEEKANEENPSASEGVVQVGDKHEMAVLKELVNGIAEPLIISQEEETKRANLLIGLYQNLANKLFWIIVIILAIAALALWKGNAQLTEKVIIALIGFIGGLGVGKGMGQN